MHSVTRTSKNNKINLNLISIFGNEVYVTIKNAKILCGYSQDANNSVITSKVSCKNTIRTVNFTKKGKAVENYVLTLEGFEELARNITQKDKKQNAELALQMIKEAVSEFLIKDLNSELDANKIFAGTITIDGSDIFKAVMTDEQYETRNEHILTDDEMVDEIVDLVGQYSSETKLRWKKLYDELDLLLDESIRKSWQRYKRDKNVNITILNYIRVHTVLLPKVLEIARNLYS